MEDKDKIKFAIRYLKLGLKSKRTPPLYEKLIQELGFEENDKIQELEKENAELKKQQFSLRNERNTFLAQNEQYEKDLIDFNEKLTKAKELLKWWVNHCGNHDLYYAKKTEGFLKEVER